MTMMMTEAGAAMPPVPADAGHAADGGWREYFTEIGGRLVMVRADVHAGGELAELDAPNLLRVQYLLPATDEDGLPLPREEAMIDALRQELKEWVGALGGRCVGESIGAGQCSWFFYVPCGWLEAANLVHRIGLRRNVTLGVEMTADAGHHIYHEALLPTPEELRRMRIAEQLAALAAQGDDMTLARDVVHEVWFDNRVQALACAEWARRAGFIVAGLLPPDATHARYRLHVQRHMAPDAAALEADVRAVAEAAQRLGGDHAGWRCDVCPVEKAS